MATVYSPPEGFEPPDFGEYIKMPNGFGIGGEYDKACEAFIARLAEEARSHNTGDLIGEVIRFGVADGMARYMVWKTKPLQLVHLYLMDGYQIPEAHERGLRVSDVRQMVARDKKRANLFGGN